MCEPATRRGLAFCAEMGLPPRGYSLSAGSDADTENEAVMSPEHAMRLWGRGVKSGRSSCLSSRSNSALTLTDTEHENKSDSDNGECPWLLCDGRLRCPCPGRPRDLGCLYLFFPPVPPFLCSFRLSFCFNAVKRKK